MTNVMEGLMKILKEAVNDDEDKEPIRSVPMTKGVKELVDRFISQIDIKKKALKKLGKELEELNHAAEDEHDKLWSTINTEMGLSSRRYHMRYNEETGEIDIMSDSWTDDEEDED